MRYMTAAIVCTCMLTVFSIFDAHAYSVFDEKFDTARSNSSSFSGDWEHDIPFFDELFDPANSAPFKLNVASHGMEIEFSEGALLVALSRANQWPRNPKSQGSTFNLSGFFTNWELGNDPNVTTIALDRPMKLKDWAGQYPQYPKNALASLKTNNSPAPVPEPATLLLLGLALSGMALLTKKRK